MFELIQIYMGEASVMDFFFSWGDCYAESLKMNYIADGMATFICEGVI